MGIGLYIHTSSKVVMVACVGPMTVFEASWLRLPAYALQRVLSCWGSRLFLWAGVYFLRSTLERNSIHDGHDDGISYYPAVLI